MGSKAIRGKVDVNKQDFLGTEDEQVKQTLSKVYEELEGDDQQKLETLKALHTQSKELQQQLDAADIDLPIKPEDMNQFLDNLTHAQAQVIYDAIRNLD